MRLAYYEPLDPALCKLLLLAHIERQKLEIF